MGMYGNGMRKRSIAGDDQATDVNHVNLEMEQNSSGEESHSLIKKNKKSKSDSLPRCYAIRRCFGCIISKEKRHINLDGSCRPKRYPTNK
jgi:hypothetical protein